MIDRATIQARRDALARQLSEAQQQYDQLEQTIAQLDRQLCAMHGGLIELDALLAAPEDVHGAIVVPPNGVERSDHGNL